MKSLLVRLKAMLKPKKMDNRISQHISYREATQSQTALRKGIDNTPSAEQLEAMKNVAEKCFEPVREWLGKPITISSFFRSEDLNTEIGGSKSSDHPNGASIDMDTAKDNRRIFEWCLENLEFDQLIWEFGGAWVHISYRMDASKNRNMVLDARMVDGELKYIDISK